MKIIITKGVGSGPTSLSAFDAALGNAGISDFNLIILSSVIPANSTISIQQFSPLAQDVGAKLYVVIAKQFCKIPGNSAWAGLSWAQNTNNDAGIFVEYGAESKENLLTYLDSTLKFMKKRRQNQYYNEGCYTVDINCINSPVCAVVAAIFNVEGWE